MGVLNNISKEPRFPILKAKSQYLYRDVLWPVILKEDEWCPKIMKSLFTAIEKVYESTYRFMAVRCDLHLKLYSEDNQVMKDFKRLLSKEVKSTYPSTFLKIYWVRERNKSNFQHYHIIVILDAKYINHPQKLNTLVENIWYQITMGSVWFPEFQYYVVKRNDIEALCALMLRLSYFAKLRTKESELAISEQHGQQSYRSCRSLSKRNKQLKS